MKLSKNLLRMKASEAARHEHTRRDASRVGQLALAPDSRCAARNLMQKSACTWRSVSPEAVAWGQIVDIVLFLKPFSIRRANQPPFAKRFLMK